MVKDALVPTPYLEALKASIASLVQKSTHFEETAAHYLEAREEAARRMMEAHDEHVALWLERDDLRKERERQLRAELDAKGLAVCSVEGEYYWKDPHKRNESAGELAQLGVFPKDLMIMVYSVSKRTHRTPGVDYPMFSYIDTDFRIFCQEHAPEEDRKNYAHSNLDVWTRVAVREGKFVREVDGQEIFESPRQGSLSQAHYEHFGYLAIPAIPEEPSYR